jgi:hypothetical protein
VHHNRWDEEESGEVVSGGTGNELAQLPAGSDYAVQSSTGIDHEIEDLCTGGAV